MSCTELGGACTVLFSGEVFEDLARQSQQHGRDMFAANDGPHIQAMNLMMELMQRGEGDAWMAARRAEFEAL